MDWHVCAFQELLHQRSESFILTSRRGHLISIAPCLPGHYSTAIAVHRDPSHAAHHFEHV